MVGIEGQRTLNHASKANLLPDNLFIQFCGYVSGLICVLSDDNCFCPSSLKTSWLKWNPDYDNAAHAFEKAGA